MTVLVLTSIWGRRACAIGGRAGVTGEEEVRSGIEIWIVPDGA